jgi:hypothetical protein
MGTIVFLVVIGTSIWVLVDAKSIGVKKGQIKGMGNMGPGGWFFVCLLLWIIGFPFYLAKRNEFKLANSNQTKKANSAPKLELNDDSLSRLEKLAELRDKGIVTEDEFNQKKQEILAL